MKLADVSVKRPVFATMMIMSLVVLGLFALTRLNVDLMPDVDFPYVVITTVLPGAGPEQIESDVTNKIEEAVNTIEGVKHIESRSQENVSIVIIEFRLEINGKQAAQDVREKVAAIRSDLPDDIEDPVIQRYDPASQPIMTLTVSGNSSEKDLTTLTKDVVKKRIENIPGVGSVNLIGGAEREINVNVNLERLKAYSLSINDIIQSVGASNVEIPGGNLNQGTRQLLLRTMGKFKNVEDFKSIIIVNNNGNTVRLGEIAEVVDGVKERESLSRYNGKTAVGLQIIKQSGSNTIQVADEVQKQLKKLEAQLPVGSKITVAQDNSSYIRDTVNDVLFDIVYGGLLAIVVIYLFLANWRSTIISAIALPTSIISTFFAMYVFNFTLNQMSLMAMSLAVGLLIDDAIVVIENIYRHLDQGETPFEAAKAASSEIGLAVLATTFTIVAVFVPVAFMQGIVGRFFYQFGITISVAVLVSLFVAFTLTPMLSSRWLSIEDEHLSKSKNIFKNFLYYFNHFFNLLNDQYKKLLAWSLKHRKTVIIGSIIIFVSSLGLGGLIGSAFFPDTDRGEFYITLQVPAGSSIEQTDNVCKIIEEKVKKVKEVTSVLTTIGGENTPVNKASVFIKLVSKKERDRDVFAIIKDIRKSISDLPGTQWDIRTESSAGGDEQPIEYSVRGDDISKISEISEKLKSIISTTPGATDIWSSYEASKPEVRIKLDRDKASDLGVNVYSVASAVRAMVDGYKATKFQDAGEQYDVRVRLNRENRTTISDIQNLMVMSNKKGPMGENVNVRLGDVAQIYESVGPSIIQRYNRQREIRIGANNVDKVSGEVVEAVNKKIAGIKLPAGYDIKLVGMSEMQEESFTSIFVSLLLAIVFIYIVLAMQFESFVYPFSIMFSLPMSLIGALLALFIFKSALSVVSLIGIIMLMGLVTKNAILLIDYANIQRERGLSRTDALLIAGPTRLRPILMTTFAMIFGMFPVAFGLGEGSEFRSPMGQAVIGGLITSTILTLVVVPVVYTIIDDFSIGNFVKVFSRVFSFAKKNKETADEVEPIANK